MGEHTLSILVADDQEITRLSFERALDRLGYTCDLAVDGDECMAKMKERNYDLLFLDLVMPGTDGETVLKNVVASYPETKVVVVSVQDEDFVIESLLERGATAYVTKPFTVESIKSVVDKLEPGGDL